MSVIYNAKILLKTGSGFPGVVLDLGEAGYDISSNKLWLGNGIGNAPTGITMDSSFNFLWDIVSGLESSSGNYATQIYVDGSLNNIRSTYIPDVSFGLESFYFDTSGYIQTSGAGAIGAGIVGKWRFNNTLSDTDPGSGFFQLNNADPSLATYIYINNNTLGSKDLSNILLDFKTGDNIYLQKLPLVSEYGIFTLTGEPINAISYVKLPVISTGVHSGSFTNNADFGTIFLYTGRDQFATTNYVDGSLSLRDTSIAWLDDNKIDIAVLPTLSTKFYVDGSLNARDLSINYLYQQTSLGASKIYVDGSLASRDASISNLYSIKANKIDVETSLGFYATNASVGLALAQRDVSISWLNTNKVNKFGDTMTGTLNINASLNVLNDVSFGSGLYVHGARGVRIDSSLGVLGDVSIGKSLRIGNDSSIGRNLPYLQLDVSNGNKVVTAGNYYGQEYQLASDLGLTSTNSTSPQTKLTMNTTNLPAGTYKVIFHWMWKRNSAANSARFDVQLNGATQGTTGTMEMEAGDTTDWRPETRIFYWLLSGTNTITFRYWGESQPSLTSVSDATIELIRVK